MIFLVHKSLNLLEIYNCPLGDEFINILHVHHSYADSKSCRWLKGIYQGKEKDLLGIASTIPEICKGRT